MLSPDQWDEAYLQTFVSTNAEGQSLDYKNLTDFSKGDARVHIAKAVSAFANATGGLLIVGVRDLKTQPPSYRVEGVEAAKLSSEQLQQIIGGNVSPRITTAIKEITLAGNPPRSVYVVDVPEGDAGKVYQSLPDKKFYRRYNDECLAMLEPEIRERYLRSAGPLLRVDLSFPLLGIPNILSRWGQNNSLLGPIMLRVVVANSAQDPSEHAVFRLSMDNAIHSPDLKGGHNDVLSTLTTLEPTSVKYGGATRSMRTWEVQWSTAKGATPIFFGLPRPLFGGSKIDLFIPDKTPDYDYLIYWTAQAPHMSPQFGAVVLRKTDLFIEVVEAVGLEVDFPAHVTP